MLVVNWEKDSILYQWPESQRLKTTLATRKTPMCYTMPGLKSDERLANKNFEKYEAFFNEHFCRVSPEMNAKGLTDLLKNKEAEIALHATSVLLSQMGQGMNKIGRTSTTNEQTLALTPQAIEEMTAFEDLDAPDLYYQFYPKWQRKGTMVPFALRLIHAEILRFTPFPWKALDRIEKLKANVELIINELKPSKKEQSITLWKSRLLAVEKIQARLLFSLGEAKQAMGCLSQLKQTANPIDKEKLCFEMMRIALSLGDESTASKQLVEASTIGSKSNDLTLHKAFRAMFLGAYTHAFDYGQRMIKAEDNRNQVPNLSAITCLYTGKVIEGVQILSKCNKPFPESVMTNIRSMSELGLPAAQRDCLMREIEQ